MSSRVSADSLLLLKKTRAGKAKAKGGIPKLGMQGTAPPPQLSSFMSKRQAAKAFSELSRQRLYTTILISILNRLRHVK